MHFAAPETLTQPQSAAPLCKNCAAQKLPVEREGKVYFYSRVRVSGYDSSSPFEENTA
jgi:hypothetical protein